MSKKKLTLATWKGARTLYGVWDTDDPAEPYLATFDNKEFLQQRDGEIVGVYELVAIQRVDVRPAVVELRPPSSRRRVTR